MANVNVKFNGKEFLLSCEDGQEEHLEELSVSLNNKFNNLKSKLGNIGENKLLLITSITIMDEYFETKKNVDLQKKEIGQLKNKFKELKSLIYDYKDNKEKQVEDLNLIHKDLKNQIEKNKNQFDEVLENTTNHIENFIKNFNKDSSIQ